MVALHPEINIKVREEEPDEHTKAVDALIEVGFHHLRMKHLEETNERLSKSNKDLCRLNIIISAMLILMSVLNFIR